MQKGWCCMRKFDYSFLNNGLLPANLVNLTSNIAALKTMAGVRKGEYTQIFTELEAVAKVQSIPNSQPARFSPSLAVLVRLKFPVLILLII